jgi:formylglycine-generating enzyme required for sulfatase activity
VRVLLLAALLASPALADEVILRGSLICNGACVSDPKTASHDLVLFAIDGTPDVKAEVDRILKDSVPDRGLDLDAAAKLLDQFSAKLKFFVDPESPAIKEGKKNTGAGHYCMPAAAMAVTGEVREKDGRKWITARRMEPAKLKYPERLLAADRPFVKQDREPVTLKIDDKHSLQCVYIPPGKFLMGTPYFMWPYHVEEYPHPVTLTRGYYLAEVPVTQALYEAVMGANPSRVKDPELPVQNPTFADVEKFCKTLTERTGKTVRLPTSAEWEYAARVGTSNPPFAEKFAEQNSSGPDGYKSVLKVKSKKPNAWGLYDMPSSWWEITGDKAMYHVRTAVTDPHYPPGTENARSQRTGRGIVNDRWSIGTHEFITEKADYAGQKFRVLVEVEK